MPSTYTIAAGDLAYIDSFAGLVPCKVLEVHPPEEGYHRAAATVRVTGARPGWPKGEEYEGALGLSIVARSQVLRAQYSTHVIGETVAG